MTRLFNEPTAFAQDMLAGFAAAHTATVRVVPGGVVRRSGIPRGQVAVVVGGGAGHYPAFAGLVGPGLAAGAVLGDVFASPSAQQVVSVVRAAEAGAGVLLSYGSYAGDVLNFSDAEQRLRDAGLHVSSVAVTDDICSAPPHERELRRGIAGDLVVFKVAGAAAAEGLDLAEVTRLARRANDRTRSIGVAFSGCTLPGATEPLFTVSEGRMAVGLGIHGEPGLSETDLPTADGLADLLVERLLAELPDGVDEARGRRVVALLNGLGAVGDEELYVVFGRVHHQLSKAGVELVEPEVGELCTSFDMAGVSLTLCWLDDELERLWTAAVSSPALRKGGLDELADLPDQPEQPDLEPDEAEVRPAGSPASQAATPVVVAVLDAVASTLAEHADELGRIDAVAGDGDHGIGMRRGSAAAAAAAREVQAAGTGVGTVLTVAGEAWADSGGGTSGALWGLALRHLGGALGDSDAPLASSLADAVHAARDAICTVGRAEVGDKTMVDALVPLDEAFRAAATAGAAVAVAWDAAATAAEQAAAGTADLLPRLGRARPHAERSLGSPDAGAVSLGLVTRAVARVLAHEERA